MPMVPNTNQLVDDGLHEMGDASLTRGQRDMSNVV